MRMSLRSANCRVNQILPSLFTFSMVAVQLSYCTGSLWLSRVATMALLSVPFWVKSPSAEKRSSLPVSG